MSRLAGVLLLLAAAAPLAAQESWTRVTYLSGASVYLEAGTKNGLKEGSRLEVVRGGSVIADLVVAFVSSTRASCTIARSTASPVVGDSVRYTSDAPATTAGPRAGESPATGDTAAAGGAARSRGTSASAHLRGRFGVRYLVVDPGAGGGSALMQPAFDVRLDGQRLGGSPFGVAVDVRAQRSSFASAGAAALTPAPTNVTRVYQASIQWSPVGSPTRLSLGRQFASALSTIGLFDGAALDVDRARWSAGALAGLQPEPVNLGLSGEVREYGAYLQLHNVPAASPLWSFTMGGVGSYDKGAIDREFLYLRATFNSPHVAAFAAQELDVNRGWKSAQEGSATTPTSTFAIVQLSLTDWLSVNGGVDNRRNVRLYRDYRNPESIFDDSFREGVWGGASLSFLGRVRLSADARTSSGGSAGTAQSFTNSVSVTRLTPLQLGLHARVTRFTGQVTAGQLESASVEGSPFGWLRVEFTAGRRDSSHPLDGSSPTHLTWTGLDADVGIGRSVYLMISTSRESGTLDHNLQSYAALSWRF